MKKLLSIFLAIVLIITAMPLGAFEFKASAANEKIVVKAVPSSSTIAVGDTFTVDFNLTTNAGFYTLGLEISYDKNILEIVCPNHKEGFNCISDRSPVTNKYKMSGVSNSASDSRFHTSTPYKIMWGFSLAEEDCTYLGRMATITFKVKALPTSNKTTISLAVDQASSRENGNYYSTERSGVGATITTCSNHVYTNACDTTCNVCNATRSVTHTYDNACDTTCNLCGATRLVTHTYDNVCDTTCNSCGETREAEHIYLDNCDCECNECHIFRKAPHYFDSDCDDTCNWCGVERETIGHVYSAVCDATCNACGSVRVTKNHTYTNSCDNDCNTCLALRTVEHTFTNKCDSECNICYEPRKAPHKYDGVCDSDCNLCGKKRTTPDHTYGDDKVCDICGHKNFVLGDADGTGEVDMEDLSVSAKYLADWEVECNQAALDVSGDGVVNLFDLVYLSQYVAGWNVTLH